MGLRDTRTRTRGQGDTGRTDDGPFFQMFPAFRDSHKLEFFMCVLFLPFLDLFCKNVFSFLFSFPVLSWHCRFYLHLHFFDRPKLHLKPDVFHVSCSCVFSTISSCSMFFSVVSITLAFSSFFVIVHDFSMAFIICSLRVYHFFEVSFFSLCSIPFTTGSSLVF